MSDDHVIDLSAYLRARDGGEADASPLALEGTDGERRRYVLPLWRMAYLASARWAGLVRRDPSGEAEAVVILDLRQEPPRPEPPAGMRGPADADVPPTFKELEGGDLAMPLGVGPDGARWFVLVGDREDGGPVTERRDDLLFLAGECAGLLTLLEGSSTPAR